MKKIFAFFLTVCLCLTVFPSVLFASAEESPIRTYDINLAQDTSKCLFHSDSYVANATVTNENKLAISFNYSSNQINKGSTSTTWLPNYGLCDNGTRIDLSGNDKILVKVVYKVTRATSDISIGIGAWDNILNSAMVVHAYKTHTASDEGKEFTLYGSFQNTVITGSTYRRNAKIAVRGNGEFEISQIKVDILSKNYTTDYCILTTVDGSNETRSFVQKGSNIPAPADKDGFEFAGWYTNPGFTGSPVTTVSADTTVYPKWDDASIVTQVVEKNADLTKSERIGTDADKGHIGTSYNDKGMVVDIENYNAKFVGQSSSTKLWLKGTLLALKYSDGSYIFLDSGRQYIFNIDYDVDRTNHATFFPSIGLVYNDNTSLANATSDNGSYVLAAKQHTNEGSYSMSAVVEGKACPVRLAFYGVGQITVKSVKISIIDSTPEKINLSKSASILAADNSQYVSYSPATAATPFTITTKSGTASGWFPFHNNNASTLKSGSQNWLKMLFSIKRSDDTYYQMYAGHKYRVIVEYAATSITDGDTTKDDGCRPAIAIVNNANASGTSDNGSTIIAADIYKEAVGTHKTFTTKFFNAVDNRPLRFAIGGRGCTIEIYSMKIIDIPLMPIVTYIDGESSAAEYSDYDADLKTPAARDGYAFMGWFDADGNKIETVSSNVTVTAQWASTTQIDFTKSERIYNISDPTKNKANLLISDDPNGMKVTFDEEWEDKTNPSDYWILGDTGSVNTNKFWANGGLIALKYADGKYVKFESGKKYIVNVKYDITDVGEGQKTPGQYPQIGLCYNNNTDNDGSDNEERMLSANRHMTCGSYTLSAVINGSQYDKKPLRLVFDGQGECIIKEVKVESIDANSAVYYVARYVDKDSNTDYAEIVEKSALLPKLERTPTLNINWWFKADVSDDSETRATSITQDGTFTKRIYNKYDLTANNVIDLRDLVRLKKSATEIDDLFYDVNRNNQVDAGDLTMLKNKLIGVSVEIINSENIAEYSIYVSNKSLTLKKAAEEIQSAVKTAFDVDLPIVYEETAKEIALVVDETVGINNYDACLQNSKLIVTAGSDYAASTAASLIAKDIDVCKAISSDYELSGKYDANYSMSGNYKYTWGDEFNGTALDNTKWTVDTSIDKTCDKYYGSEHVKTVDGDYTVADGVLTMNTRKTEYGYSQTKLDANKQFKFGIMEMKVKFGEGKGGSYNLWARSVDGSDKNTSLVNEFDFIENFGYTSGTPNLHTWKYWGDKTIPGYHTNHGSDITVRNDVENITDGEYHYISMEWTANIVRFYFDGELYLEQEITDQSVWAAFQKSTYLILGIGVPTMNDKTYETIPSDFSQDVSNFSDSMSVDFVRVYQLGSDGYSVSNK